MMKDECVSNKIKNGIYVPNPKQLARVKEKVDGTSAHRFSWWLRTLL